MHQELDVNIEGIDVVFLLQKIETLQKELVEVKTGYACMKIKNNVPNSSNK
jgi:hypothetical protein